MKCNLCSRFASSERCQPCTARVDYAKRMILSRVITARAREFAERDASNRSVDTLREIKPSHVKPTPEPAGDGDTAVSGREGVKAEELLKTAKDRAVRTLSQITRQAVLRLLSDPRWLKTARDLYTPDEKRQLTELLAATSATANLLGRARIRGRVNANLAQFSEVWLQFADEPSIKPMAPEAAVAYFKGLQPGISTPERFGDDQRRKAFTLAGVTEKALLGKVKGVISDGLASGESTTALAQQVGDVLQAAGVHPKNPQYAEMVVRTNLLDAYNQGQYDEVNTPEMRDFFPVWRYDAILDTRVRPEHAERNGKYYPVSASFARVRGTRPGDVVNCRCTMTPVNQFDWEDLQKSGARVESGYGPVEQPKPPTTKKPKKVEPVKPPEPPTPPVATLPDPGEVYAGKYSRAEMEAIARQVGVDPVGKSEGELRNELANKIDLVQSQRPTPPPPTPAVPTAPEVPAVPQGPLPVGKDLNKKKPLAEALSKAAQESEELSPDQRQKYAQTMKQVVARMPARAQKLIKENLNRVTFYPEQKRITEGAINEMLADPNLPEEQRQYLLQKLEETKAGQYNAGGVYNTKGGIHLDGDWEYTKDPGATGEPEAGKYTPGVVLSRRDIYSHELTHAIDGPDGNRMSDSDEWQKAWKAEIRYSAADLTGKEPPLTAYGGKVPVEGFAEFGRLVYGTDVPLEQIERDFPQASAFFKSKGLWPAQKKEGKTTKADEIFDKRIDLDDKGSHIDTVKVKPQPKPPEPEEEFIPIVEKQPAPLVPKTPARAVQDALEELGYTRADVKTPGDIEDVANASGLTPAEVRAALGMAGTPANLPKATLNPLQGYNGGRAKYVLGQKPSPQLIGGVIGAQDGAEVYARIDEAMDWQELPEPPQSDVLIASVENDRYFLSRRIYRNAQDELVIYNDLITVKEKGQGLGTKVFTEQVANAAQAGVVRIHARAEGNAQSKDYNGYYTWPRMGYDGPIPETVLPKLPPEYADAKTVQDILSRPGGSAWWKANGDSFEATFDLKEGSRSRAILAAYLKEKGLPVKFAETAEPEQAEDIPLDPDEEEALDRLWVRIEAEGWAALDT